MVLKIFGEVGNRFHPALGPIEPHHGCQEAAVMVGQEGVIGGGIWRQVVMSSGE